MRPHWPTLFFGALFGFIISRAGATSFEAINHMFLLTDLHLYGVIGGAIAVAMPGLYIMKRLKRAGKIKRPLRFASRRFTPGTLIGSALFGLGWAVTGTCPGPAIVQVGEGHVIALATVAGIFVGNWAYGWLHARVFTWTPDICS